MVCELGQCLKAVLERRVSVRGACAAIWGSCGGGGVASSLAGGEVSSVVWSGGRFPPCDRRTGNEYRVTSHTLSVTVSIQECS